MGSPAPLDTANRPASAHALRNICIIGMMGSGKSTIGALLAGRLACPFLDLDNAVAAALGRDLPEIFAQLGEARFRREEQRQLRQYCADGRRVIACGGGVVLAAANRQLLLRQTTVYLRASPAVLARRVGAGAGRPLLAGAGSVTRRLEAALRERGPLYRECAHLTLSTEAAAPEHLAEELLFRLRELSPAVPS